MIDKMLLYLYGYHLEYHSVILLGPYSLYFGSFPESLFESSFKLELFVCSSEAYKWINFICISLNVYDVEAPVFFLE